MVVVLPCVPVTTSESWPGRKNSCRICGSERYGDLVIEHVFHFRIAARCGVADHHQVRRRREILFAKTVFPADAQPVEQRGSRRIHASVRTGDAIAAFGQHARERSHGRAADADEVNRFDGCGFHFCRVTTGSRISSFPSPRARKRARTPSGIVSMGRDVCPTAAPKTTGTPSCQASGGKRREWSLRRASLSPPENHSR